MQSRKNFREFLGTDPIRKQVFEILMSGERLVELELPVEDGLGGADSDIQSITFLPDNVKNSITKLCYY